MNNPKTTTSMQMFLFHNIMSSLLTAVRREGIYKIYICHVVPKALSVVLRKYNV